MNNTELARRALACKKWRWMVGMRTDGGSYIINDAAPISVLQHINCTDTDRSTDWLPDLTDPATIGCLHHLVCEAYNAFQIRVQVSIAPDMSGRDHATWTAVDARGSIRARGGFRTTSRVDLMADGLVAALEAAP
jgi:hypothetical protein